MNAEEPIQQSNSMKRIIQFLMDKTIINKELSCTRCAKQMQLKERLTGDHFTWRCPKCSTFKSLRAGSIFSETRLSLIAIVRLMYHFSAGSTVSEAARFACKPRSTVTDFYQKLRFEINLIIYWISNIYLLII